MTDNRRAARVGSAAAGSSAVVAFLVAIVTNYVTAQPPKWAENTLLVWSVFGALAMVSLGLFFWERRLAAQAPENGVRPVPLGRIAVGGHSMNPPTASARVRGREAELERIGARVRASGGGMVVVCGAGGLGKTTLAAESAAQARAQGQAVVWIRWRDDPAQLGQDLAQAAHILGLPDSRLEEARMGRVSLVDAVGEHLADVTGWLIVVDNVDTPAHVGPGSGPPAAYRGWLRPYGGGVLLVTSRDTTRQTWGPDADVLHLQPLADDAGGADEAEALAARLGGLPLGLNAAATYLSVPTSRHRTFTAYQHAMDRVRRSPGRRTPHRSHRPGHRPPCRPAHLGPLPRPAPQGRLHPRPPSSSSSPSSNPHRSPAT
ncbi:ATP-binding protein [Streptomyces sp. NPDC094458]|uniref:ATP-binding protein n=1 Tax=Streptomyces sp. NPDC094458 TaxID=3155208 RepID=UPI0033171E70